MIRRIAVSSYRCLDFIDLQLLNFQILVGPNGSGKSTFLDVINLIRDILNGGIRSAIEKRSSNFEELMYNRQGNRFSIALELEIPTNVKQKLGSDNYSLVRYVINILLDDEMGIIIDSIDSESVWLIDKLSKKYRKKNVIFKTPDGQNSFKSETSRRKFTYRPDPQKSALVVMPEDEWDFPVTLWAKRFLMDGVQFLQLNSEKMRWSCRPDLPIAFQTDGSNLPKVIQHLSREDPDFFVRWTRHIKAFLPDVEEIKVKEIYDNRNLYVSIRYKNGLELPSWLISDGTLRFLAQTIIAYLPERNKIYMIEEPENGLHPLAIEGIFQSLSSVYENQVFLATHSPYILGLAEPSQILCFSKDSSGAVNIINGQDHPMLKDWKKGVDLATLHAAGVLQ